MRVRGSLHPPRTRARSSFQGSTRTPIHLPCGYAVACTHHAYALEAISRLQRERQYTYREGTRIVVSMSQRAISRYPKTSKTPTFNTFATRRAAAPQPQAIPLRTFYNTFINKYKRELHLLRTVYAAVINSYDNNTTTRQLSPFLCT